MPAPARWVVLAASLLFAGGAFAQPGTSSTRAPPPIQSALSQHVAPRAAELAAVGIQKINARTGMKRRDIQVLSQYGTIYFPWPEGVTPATFELDNGKGGPMVRAAGYTDAERTRYVAAIDAVLPVAIKRADEAKVNRTRPKP
jgi:hypothetical protein